MTATPRLLVAVDVRTTDVGGAEHVVHQLDDVLPVDLPSYVASTHVVADGGPHTAVAVSWDDDGLGPVEAWCDGVAALLPDAGVVVETGDRVAVAGPQDRWAGARSAAAEHRSRRAGRIARFAGLPGLEREEVTVDEVLASGGVDEVVAVGAPALAPDAVLDLREWARPIWRDGRSVLVVQPARTGLVPFESRHQIACCADH